MTEDADRHALAPSLLHDLRTPLGQIIGYAELLAERAEETDDERFSPDLEKISAAGYRMLALMEESFTATRPDAAGALTWDDVEMLRSLAGGHPPDPEAARHLADRIAALLPPRA
jgi:signal transduction histidine kinase